jgi:hypothetical protein
VRTSLTTSYWVAVIGIFIVPSSTHAQTLPPDRSVVYLIHSDGHVPTSPVVFEVKIRLEAQQATGNDVAWRASLIEIEQFDHEGRNIGSWKAVYPDFATSDGLWHVTHANAAAPAVAEFDLIPELSGVAEGGSGMASLDYFLSGSTADVGQTPPYAMTAMLNYSFWRGDEPEPTEEEDDEPTEGGPGPDNPL